MRVNMDFLLHVLLSLLLDFMILMDEVLSSETKYHLCLLRRTTTSSRLLTEVVSKSLGLVVVPPYGGALYCWRCGQ